MWTAFSNGSKKPEFKGKMMVVENLKECCLEAYALGLIHGQKKTISEWVEEIHTSKLKNKYKGILVDFLTEHQMISESALVEHGDTSDM